MSIEKSNEVRVKDEAICDSQSELVKEEPIDSEIQKPSNAHIDLASEEFEVKTEEKFSATEEFANKTSIAFLNEETTSTDNHQV